MSKKKRRRFSDEFKRDVVEMVTTGGHDAWSVSRELDLRPDMIRKWVRRFSPEEDGETSPKDRDAEMAKLRRELSRVREERDILKKAVAIFSERRR